MARWAGLGFRNPNAKISGLRKKAKKHSTMGTVMSSKKILDPKTPAGTHQQFLIERQMGYTKKATQTSSEILGGSFSRKLKMPRSGTKKISETLGKHTRRLIRGGWENR